MNAERQEIRRRVIAEGCKARGSQLLVVTQVELGESNAARQAWQARELVLVEPKELRRVLSTQAALVREHKARA